MRALVVAEFYPRVADPALGIWAQVPHYVAAVPNPKETQPTIELVLGSLRANDSE